LRRYRQILAFAVPYWRGSALIAAVTLVSIATSLLQPWPMKVLVDQVLGHEPPSAVLARVLAWLPGAGTTSGLLAWTALAGLVLFAVHSIIDVVLTFGWIRVGQRMVYDLTCAVFARVQRRSLTSHAARPIGDSLARITGDSWCISLLVDNLFLGPLFASIMLGAMLVILLRLDVQLTLLALVVAPLMVSASVLFGRPLRAVAQERRTLESLMQAHVQQTLTGIPVVQAFGQEQREHRRFREVARSIIRAHQRGSLVGGLHGLGTGLGTTLGLMAVLWVGAHRVLDGALTLGSLLVFLAYLGSLQAQLKVFAGAYANVQGARASADRVLEVLEADDQMRERPGARPLGAVSGHIRMENVSFGYQPDEPVIQNVTLEARPGETVAIVGPTGAGKSTLVGLVPRFFDPWAGRVTVDGHDLRDVRLESLRSQIALLLQEPFLFPVSLAENIAYGRPGATPAEIEDAARAANAHGFIEQLPAGYDTVIGERGTTLSGGERQRVAIARALLRDAPILILDEPTSALDAETEASLLEALERLMVRRTTLIIAHRLSTIRRANRIVVLEDGIVKESGTHDELLARDGSYRRLNCAHAVPAAGVTESRR
jgi:ABC-type multidrug transport system fused ATPase/permease subunit